MVGCPRSAPRPAGGGVLAGVAWVAFKVGALSFGGGFVIIPLMRADAVGRGWMTGGQFLNAVALGQITPGPVVQTVSAVGYAAAGVGGGLLAALVAFSPSFVFVLGGARYFSVLRTSRVAQAFLDGAGPARSGRSWARPSCWPGRCASRGSSRCWPRRRCCCSGLRPRGGVHPARRGRGRATRRAGRGPLPH